MKLIKGTFYLLVIAIGVANNSLDPIVGVIFIELLSGGWWTNY